MGIRYSGPFPKYFQICFFFGGGGSNAPNPLHLLRLCLIIPQYLVGLFHFIVYRKPVTYVTLIVDSFTIIPELLLQQVLGN